MVVKNCFFGNCRSDSRKKDPMITFAPMPKPKNDLARAKQWLHLSGRIKKDWPMERLNKGKYFVCNKHFAGFEDLSWKNKSLTPFAFDVDPEKREKAEERMLRTYNRSMDNLKKRIEQDEGGVFSREELKALAETENKALKEKRAEKIANQLCVDPLLLETLIKKEPGITEEKEFTFKKQEKKVKTYAFQRRSEAFMKHLIPTVLLAENVAMDTTSISVKEDPIDSTVLEKPDVLKRPADFSPPCPMPDVKKPKPIFDRRTFKKVNKGVQCSMTTKQVILALKKENAMLRESLKCSFPLQIKSSDSRSLYYTGLDNEGRNLLFNFASKGASEQLLIGNSQNKRVKDLKCTLENQFMLTLVKLRRNFQYEDLAIRFGTQTRICSQIFKTWIYIMYTKFLEIRRQLFIRYDHLNKPLPEDFQNSYIHRARCVIDTLEFKIESSKNQFKQNTSTCKVLVGITPAGSFGYASDCFDGKTKDKDIVRHCGFLDFLDSHDVVVVGRSFSISDLLSQRGATLMGPSSYDSEQTRVVQTAAGSIRKFRTKLDKFRFICGTIPHNSVPILSQIIYVCCCMINFFPNSPIKIKAC